MRYIEESLGANETVHYVAHFHWMQLCPGLWRAGPLASSSGIFTYALQIIRPWR